MTRFDCRRCSWRPEDIPGYSHQYQLRQHASETGHDLCAVCAVSLPWEQPATCLPCIATVRADLDNIVTLYALLPEQLGQPKTPSLERARGSDDTSMPGGDPLTLLAEGSEGAFWRGRNKPTALAGTPWRAPQRLRPHDGVWVEDEANDNWPGDAQSVASVLAIWEDDFREQRQEPAANENPTVAGCAGYLMARLTWASEHHPAFYEFATETARLHRQLEIATSNRAAVEVGVGCLALDCDGILRRIPVEGQPCRHTRPTQRLLDGETVKARNLRLAVWEAEHATCNAGGRPDQWTCQRCRRTYTDEEHRLAVRQHHEQRQQEESA